MAKMRKPFQGVWNIVRFNWHFYLIAFCVVLSLLFLSNFFPEQGVLFWIATLLIIIPTAISLSVSYYVYDASGLYNLDWIYNDYEKLTIVNINAGFDETSILLKEKFPESTLIVFDFYDPEYHTEVSIKRARNAYPPYPETLPVQTTHLPLPDNFADKIFVTFAAHEIRNNDERVTFFKELKRIIKPAGQIIITEHLRDVANFMAYNIGYMHFHSRATWIDTFQGAALTLESEKKCTPFISIFTITKHGVTS